MDKMNKMEEKLANMSPEQLSHNAQHIWQMLDDMAQNNPQMYRKFIDKQMAESKKYNAKPQPHMCIQTKINAPEESGLFINVFDWTRVPEPKSDADPIPVIGGSMYDGRDDTGVYKIVTVAFNPKVTADFGIDSDLRQERRMLINLAIDFLQNQHKCTISRNYTLLRKPKRYKGTLVKAIQTVTKRATEQDSAVEKEIGELEKMFGSLADSDKNSLMGELSNISVSKDSASESAYVEDDPEPFEPETSKDTDTKSPISSRVPQQTGNGKPEIKLNVSEPNDLAGKLEKDIKMPGSVQPSKKAGVNLIQEVGVANGKKSLIEPEYCIETRGTTDDRETLVVRIRLPDVTSVADCELDISKNDLHLLVEDQYELKLPFDISVDEQEAKAKFSKKSSTLTLSIPVL